MIVGLLNNEYKTVIRMLQYDIHLSVNLNEENSHQYCGLQQLN